jgi:hypothetical protein
MRADFSAMGRAARELIAAPVVPMEAIRGRAQAARVRDRARMLIACAALAIGALGATVGLDARIYEGIRVWLSGGKAAIEVRSLVLISNPTAPDLRRAVAHATFPVILPVGVPGGSRIIHMGFAPAVRPDAVFVQYRNPRVNFNVGFLLVDSTDVSAAQAFMPTGVAKPRFGDVYQWRVGSETVIVPQKASISADDVRRVEAAMMKTTPSDSLAANEAMLYRITVLGGFYGVADIAERIAPSEGPSVLVDRGHLTLIPSLTEQNKPLLDTRTVHLSDIPTVNGRPDYSRATLYWPRIVAVPASGVRAIATVLRSTSTGLRCQCEILFHQPNPQRYWIWTIPTSAGAPMKKYFVEAGHAGRRAAQRGGGA